jgi:D-aminopeptidase
MICHDFKGRIGTASRMVELAGETYTVGALVESNYGSRELFRVDGVPVGQEIDGDEVPLAKEPVPPRPDGSIIVVLATDAPLLPIQCKRLARRATTGLAWVGGIGGNGSGDIFLAFSTGNTVRGGDSVSTVRSIAAESMTALFLAAAEAAQEAILNSMTAAETTTGFKGRTVHALPLDHLPEVMKKYRPG